MMTTAKIENDLPFPSQRQSKPDVLAIPYDNQQEVSRKSGPILEAPVASVGVNEKKMGKTMES